MKQADARCTVGGLFFVVDRVARKRDRIEVTYYWQDRGELRQEAQQLLNRRHLQGLYHCPGTLSVVTPRGRVLKEELGVLESVMYAPYDFYTVFVFRDD